MMESVHNASKAIVCAAVQLPYVVPVQAFLAVWKPCAAQRLAPCCVVVFSICAGGKPCLQHLSRFWNYLLKMPSFTKFLPELR